MNTQVDTMIARVEYALDDAPGGEKAWVPLRRGDLVQVLRLLQVIPVMVVRQLRIDLATAVTQAMNDLAAADKSLLTVEAEGGKTHVGRAALMAAGSAAADEAAADGSGTVGDDECAAERQADGGGSGERPAAPGSPVLL